MKNHTYSTLITCILTLSYAAQIYSLNVDIKQLFGTWQCLKDDKKYLSPLNGAICAETAWIENMYRFGEVDTEVVIKDGRQVFKKREESKRRIKQNATSELVFLLFNAFPNIDGIHVSKIPASPSPALSPELVGQLLNEIEKLIGTPCQILFDSPNLKNWVKIEENLSKKREKDEGVGKLKVQLQQLSTALDKGKIAQSAIENKKKERDDLAIKIKTWQEALQQNIKTNIATKLEGELKTIFDICDSNIGIVFHTSEANETVKSIMDLLASKKVQNAEHFLQTFLKSLLECGLLKLEPFDQEKKFGPFCIGSTDTTYQKYFLVFGEAHAPKDKLPVLQELQFVPYTTHNILLSLLAMKLNTPDDLQAYFGSFKPSIMKNNWKEQCKPQIDNDTKQFEVIRTSTNYEKTLEDACKNKKLKDCYELIACTEIEMLNPRQAPKRFIYGTSKIEIDGKTYSFSDCTETSLLNFICLVLTKLGLYDWEKKSFLLNDHERVKKAISWLITQESHVKKTEQKPAQEEIDQHIKNFLPNGFFEFFATDVWKEPFEAHNMWAQLISNKSDKGLEYLNNNTYELKPDPKNFVAAFKYLCGCSCDTFDQICSILEIYDSKNRNTFSLGEFEKNKKYVGTAIWRISKDFEPSIDLTFNLSFKPGHAVFALSRNEGKATPFIESIFKESTTNQLTMLLTYLYAYRNLKLDKKLALIDFSKEPSELKLAIFRYILYGYDFAKTRTRLMNFIKWLYKTEEKISNKEILTAKLDEYKDSDGDTLLNCAIAWDENEIAKLLIEHGTNINEKNNLGNTPLHRAVRQGKSDIVDILIKKGANINEKNNYGNTPLHSAVSQGKSDIVTLLIKKGANSNEKAVDGDTPLHRAIFLDQPEQAKLLIEQLKGKVNLNEQNDHGSTPLHLAIFSDQPEIAEMLIKQLIKDNANLNEKNVDGNTPLHLAIYRKQLEIAKLLIKQLIKDKANLNEQEKNGNTPLHLAIDRKQPDIAKILIDQLIKNKADLNKKNVFGNTPLHLALWNHLPDIAKILIDQLIKDKADLNKKNVFGNTPLHLALWNHLPDIAKILIDQLIEDKADLNQKSSFGDTPLHLAITNRHPDIAKILINQIIKDKADLNPKNASDKTPLHMAIEEKLPDIAKILIAQLIADKADLNQKSSIGETPLHLAIDKKLPDIAAILIDQLIKDKAYLNQKNDGGETPLDLAKKNGYDDIVYFLEKGMKETK